MSPYQGDLVGAHIAQEGPYINTLQSKHTLLLLLSINVGHNLMSAGQFWGMNMFPMHVHIAYMCRLNQT